MRMQAEGASQLCPSAQLPPSVLPLTSLDDGLSPYESCPPPSCFWSWCLARAADSKLEHSPVPLTTLQAKLRVLEDGLPLFGDFCIPVDPYLGRDAMFHISGSAKMLSLFILAFKLREIRT